MAIQFYLALLLDCHASLRSLAMTRGTHPGLRPPLPAGAERPGVGGELVTGFKFSSLGGVRRSREVGCPCPNVGRDLFHVIPAQAGIHCVADNYSFVPVGNPPRYYVPPLHRGELYQKTPSRPSQANSLPVDGNKKIPKWGFLCGLFHI